MGEEGALAALEAPDPAVRGGTALADLSMSMEQAMQLAALVAMGRDNVEAGMDLNGVPTTSADFGNGAIPPTLLVQGTDDGLGSPLPDVSPFSSAQEQSPRPGENAFPGGVGDLTFTASTLQMSGPLHNEASSCWTAEALASAPTTEAFFHNQQQQMHALMGLDVGRPTIITDADGKPAYILQVGVFKRKSSPWLCLSVVLFPVLVRAVDPSFIPLVFASS
jgi:hypothetical protein